MTSRSSSGLTVRAGCLLLGVAVLIILAGCGTSKDGSETADGKVPSTPASPPPRAAADGTDLNACEDGSCEVEVTGPATLPVDSKKFKTGTLEVEPGQDDTVSFTMKQSGNSSTSVQVCSPDGGCTNLGGGGYSSGGGDVESSSAWTAGAGTRITANGIVITVVSVADGSAILRVTPR
ncbi:hypothetical protein GCM10023085_23680 [Actinomadura viridis]|uniref:Lipoprotein n=1 Tax=Actinomadura viridis TaxID=58110 RepID=A0A931DJJ5_9ACTN|nr:hypothetical protein [Actinomadura viridis]MBG6088741.1 hypothetical protein [Actinomadura viridis]